jgi:hypothetical protein
MAIRRFVSFAIMMCLQAGCGSLPVGTPIAQVEIPELESGKSRVFFYYHEPYGPAVGSPQLVRMASDDSGLLKSLVVLNHVGDCSYVDLMPGAYKIRVVGSTAGGAFWWTKQHAVDISLDAGSTYYVQVAWYVKSTGAPYDLLIYGPWNLPKGIALIPMDPGQGQADLARCRFIEREETLKLVGKLNGD